MKTIKIIQEIYSDIGPRGEDYGVPYLKIDPDILEKNGYKVGDIVEITITPRNQGDKSMIAHL